MKVLLLATLGTLLLPFNAAAQEWSGPVRGSWVRPDGQVQAATSRSPPTAAAAKSSSRDEHSAVAQAAAFLAADIERISGYKPPIVDRRPEPPDHAAGASRSTS